VKKNLLFVSLAFVLLLCACNRKEFVNKLCGTWKLNKYLYANQDKTAAFDTTNNGYQLQINQNNTFTESYKIFTFISDSTITSDTVSGVVHYDTLRFVDTTITPYLGNGTWQLVNSEEDLQLLNNGASDSTARMFNILTLTKSNLNLLNGNKEYDLKK